MLFQLSSDICLSDRQFFGQMRFQQPSRFPFLYCTSSKENCETNRNYGLHVLAFIELANTNWEQDNHS